MSVADPASSGPCLSLPEAIRHRRRALGLSQAELARRVGNGITPRQIHRLEVTGAWMPSWILLQQVAVALELPQETLLSDCIVLEPMP